MIYSNFALLNTCTSFTRTTEPIKAKLAIVTIQPRTKKTFVYFMKGHTNSPIVGLKMKTIHKCFLCPFKIKVYKVTMQVKRAIEKSIIYN